MRTRALVLVVTLTATLAACGSGGPATSSLGVKPTSTTTTIVDLSAASFVDDTGSPKAKVDAIDNNFQDQYIEVKAGTTVTFTNAGHNEHNVLPAVDGAFKGRPTDQFEPGTSFSLTFDEPGDYPFYCSLHGTTTKGMTGAIRVVP